MLIIRNAADLARALDSPTDPQLKQLLAVRRDQLFTDTGGDYELGELVHFVVAQPDDTIAAIEADRQTPPALGWRSVRAKGVIATSRERLPP